MYLLNGNTAILEKLMCFYKTFFASDEVVFSAVWKFAYFTKLQRKHFFHDQQLDVTAGGKDDEDNDGTLLEDDDVACFNKLSHVRF